VFNHSTPSTGNNDQRSAHNNILTKVTAMAVTATLGSALALAAPLSASAATPPVSYGSGQFLSGSVGGMNLAKLAAIEAASAQNDGSQSAQVSRDPLGVSALGATVINQPAGIQLNLGHIVDLGAANQYAQATKDGSSYASSGAVNNDGGVGVGTVGTAADGSATVDLDSLLGSKFASVLSDLKLTTSAVSAQAAGALKNASGSYTLADLDLEFTSPAIAGLSGKVAQALGPIDGQVAGLDGPNGQLAQSVSGVVTRISPLLKLSGAGASVSANVSVDLNDALQPLLTGIYGNGAVSFNLQTGEVKVNLAKLLGGNINKEPAGTEVLSDKVVNEILTGITGTIDSLLDQIVAKAKQALENAAVNVDATVNLATPQAPLLGQTCVQGGTGTSGTGGLLGGLLGGSGTLGLGGLLCTNTSKLLPDLKTALAVHVHGTVDQLVSGTAPAANATLSLLGLPVTVNLSDITTGIGTQLTDHLLDGTPGQSGLATALNTGVLAPAVTGLLGSGSSVENALTHVLSVKLNNQDTDTTAAGSTFTETALKVSVLPDGTNSAATINLANATVGPNATTVVPGDPSDPGNPGDPTEPGSPSNPTTPGSPSIPTALGNLAFTGVGLTGLVSAILALLAAGAYLVREGYRRNSRRQIP
jgi:hypothetical protein